MYVFGSGREVLGVRGMGMGFTKPGGTGGREGSTQFAHGFPDHCDSSTACMLCGLEPI